MYNKVLIANRGECALRIIRACRELGVRAVAVYSEADAGFPHMTAADEAICVGPAPAAASYLNAPRIIQAAQETGAQAVHPGWGFLAENADFAQACTAAGLTFIGPPAQVIRAMGDKNRARQRARQAGMPVVPGTESEVDDGEIAAAAAALGYPVVLKASAGGGGIGMAVVHEPGELAAAVKTARGRAERAFGHPGLYLEKFIAGARHVEVQLLADGKGRVIAFPERECSVQRRYQKVLEETPSPVVTPDLRTRLQEAAVRLARAIGYANLGTVEFLLGRDGRFYFLETNTRLQVEHGITELVSGADLVQAGIRVAAGEPLPVTDDRVPWRGHAIEARIYAEDPVTFLPSPGRVSRLVEPHGDGLRLDSGLVAGLDVSPFYDPLVAKLMAWGQDRDEAVTRLRAGLEGFVVEGIKTNIPLHLRVLSYPPFLVGEYDTGCLDVMHKVCDA